MTEALREKLLALRLDCPIDGMSQEAASWASRICAGIDALLSRLPEAAPPTNLGDVALRWQHVADEFCVFNQYADRVMMHNFAGWLAQRGTLPDPWDNAPLTVSALAALLDEYDRADLHEDMLGIGGLELASGNDKYLMQLAAWWLPRLSGLGGSPEGPWLIAPIDNDEQPGWRIYGEHHGDQLRMSADSFSEAEALAVRDALNRVPRLETP